jgi:hypothetical protein
MRNFKPDPIQAHVNVDVNQLENVKCACGNQIFMNLYQLKHVSAFFTNTGKASGIEMKMYVCINPKCGLMFGGAIEQAEVKKLARNPAAPRFNWVDFFKAGFMSVEEAGAKLVERVAEHVAREKETEQDRDPDDV